MWVLQNVAKWTSLILWSRIKGIEIVGGQEINARFPVPELSNQLQNPLAEEERREALLRSMTDDDVISMEENGDAIVDDGVDDYRLRRTTSVAKDERTYPSTLSNWSKFLS